MFLINNPFCVTQSCVSLFVERMEEYSEPKLPPGLQPGDVKKYKKFAKRIYSGNDKVKSDIAEAIAFFCFFKRDFDISVNYSSLELSADFLEIEKLLKEFDKYFFDTLILNGISVQNISYEYDLSHAIFCYVCLFERFLSFVEQKKPEKEIKEFFDTETVPFYNFLKKGNLYYLFQNDLFNFFKKIKNVGVENIKKIITWLEDDNSDLSNIPDFGLKGEYEILKQKLPLIKISFIEYTKFFEHEEPFSKNLVKLFTDDSVSSEEFKIACAFYVKDKSIPTVEILKNFAQTEWLQCPVILAILYQNFSQERLQELASQAMDIALFRTELENRNHIVTKNFRKSVRISQRIINLFVGGVITKEQALYLANNASWFQQIPYMHKKDGNIFLKFYDDMLISSEDLKPISSTGPLVFDVTNVDEHTENPQTSDGENPTLKAGAIEGNQDATQGAQGCPPGLITELDGLDAVTPFENPRRAALEELTKNFKQFYGERPTRRDVRIFEYFLTQDGNEVFFRILAQVNENLKDQALNEQQQRERIQEIVANGMREINPYENVFVLFRIFVIFADWVKDRLSPLNREAAKMAIQALNQIELPAREIADLEAAGAKKEKLTKFPSVHEAEKAYDLGTPGVN